ARILHLLAESLELALANLGEVAAMLGRSRILVQEDRDAELFGHGGPDLARQRHAFLDRAAANGDERDDVHGSHPRMLSPVRSQVDPSDGFAEEGEDSRANGGGVTHEGQNAAI